MEVIFLDNGLIGKGEHSYSLIKQVGEALTRRGYRHRTFGTKSMEKSVSDELGAVPHFTYSLYLTLDVPADVPAAEKSRAPSLFERIFGSTDDPVDPSELETWKLLNTSYEQDLAALPADIWNADNLLVMPGVTQNELLGLGRALLAKPESLRPRVICQLMFPPDWTARGRLAKLGEKFYRQGFAVARPLIGKTLFFTTENDAIGRIYRRKFRINTRILPVPFGDVRAAAPPAARPTLGFFGYSKCEKGFHLLPRAIEICRARGVEAEFTIQLQHHKWEPATISADESLRRMYGVRLIEGVLNQEDYTRETSRVDAMLLPYDPVLFGLRGSGIFTRSVAAGRPVVASAGTFAGESIAARQAEGEVFSPYDAPTLAAAIERLIPRMAESQRRAATLAKAFASKHSPDAYVDVLLARP